MTSINLEIKKKIVKLLIKVRFLYENDDCSARCLMLCTDVFLQVNFGWNE